MNQLGKTSTVPEFPEFLSRNVWVSFVVFCGVLTLMGVYLLISSTRVSTYRGWTFTKLHGHIGCCAIRKSNPELVAVSLYPVSRYISLAGLDIKASLFPGKLKVIKLNAPQKDIWSITTQDEIVRSLSWSNHDLKLASSSFPNGSLPILFDIPTASSIKSPRSGPRIQSCFSPDDKLLALGAIPNSTVIDLESRISTSTIPLISMQFADSRTLIATSAQGEVIRWKIDSNEFTSWSIGAASTRAACAPDGRQFVITSENGEAEVYETASLRRLAIIALGKRELVPNYRAVFSHTGRTLICTSEKLVTWVSASDWTIKSREPFGLPGNITALASSLQAPQVIIGTDSGILAWKTFAEN